MGPGKTHGVFSFAAAKFQHDGVVVAEEVGMPLSLQGEPLFHDALVGVLKQIVERPVLLKFLQFVLLAHGGFIWSGSMLCCLRLL